MKTFLKISLFCLIAIFTIIFGLSLYSLILVKNVHLDETKLISKTTKYEFYDNNNELIDVNLIKNQNNYVSFSELNPQTINAFIAIEDKRFYTHKGIDYKRIVGASISNLKSLQFKEGASTISQQLIKNTHLNNQKTLKRKLFELKITTELEKKYTKNEILEKYLNTIYFGGGAYGINNASMLYFDKNAKDLTINESCLLAGLIKAPSKYSPIQNYENAINRKNVVLKSMLNNNFISKDEYEKLLVEKIQIVKNNSNDAFNDYINACLLEYEDLNVNPYNFNTIKIYTALDKTLQKNISEIKVLGAPKTDRKQIVINSKNGEVIAFYGKNSNYKRCPASTVKPWLVYAPSINENFIKESTVLKDVKKNFGGYTPKNYADKYYGNVTVKTALKNSLNVTAVDLLNSFGINKSINYANKMNVKIANKDLSIALGAIDGGMTLQEICDCYSPFSNDGYYVKSHFIKKVVGDNKTLYENINNYASVFKSETAFIINDILKDGTKTGTSKKLKDFDFDLCAKTGTNGTNDGNLDAYSVAYTKNHILATWLGNNDNSLMPNTVTGGNYPTFYQREALNYLYSNSKPDNFTMPSNVTSCHIDEEFLLKNEKEVVLTSDLGVLYYYILGTQPTETLKIPNGDLIKVNDYKIELNKNVVNINLDATNVKEIKVFRCYNGNKIMVYNGNYIDKICDTIYNFGKYEYEVVLSNLDKTSTIKLPNVIYEKSSLSTINSDDWLND